MWYYQFWLITVDINYAGLQIEHNMETLLLCDVLHVNNWTTSVTTPILSLTFSELNHLTSYTYSVPENTVENNFTEVLLSTIIRLFGMSSVYSKWEPYKEIFSFQNITSRGAKSGKYNECCNTVSSGAILRQTFIIFRLLVKENLTLSIFMSHTLPTNHYISQILHIFDITICMLVKLL
jgi:hypothetical protein